MYDVEVGPEHEFISEALAETFKIMDDAGEGVNNAQEFIAEALKTDRADFLIDEADKAWLSDVGIDPKSLK